MFDELLDDVHFCSTFSNKLDSRTVKSRVQTVQTQFHTRDSEIERGFYILSNNFEVSIEPKCQITCLIERIQNSQFTNVFYLAQWYLLIISLVHMKLAHA